MIFSVGIAVNVAISLAKTDKRIWESLSHFSFEYLALAAALALIPWLTGTVRLTIWTRFLGERYSFVDLFKIIVGCDIGSAISPTAVGGGYVKLFMLSQRGMKAGAAASVMLLASLEDLVFFIFAIPMALVLTSGSTLASLGGYVARIREIKVDLLTAIIIPATVLILVVVLKKSPLYRKLISIAWVGKLRARVKTFWLEFVTVYRRIGKTGKRRLLLTMPLTAVQWTARYSVITALLACFHVPLKPVEFFLLQWVVFTITTLTPTPGGTIGAEAAFLIIYRTYVPAEMIGLVTAAWRFLTFYFLFGLGAVLFGALQFTPSGRKKTRRIEPQV